MALTLVITDAGRAALVNARNDGTNAVRIASAGVSATAIVASPAATTLPGEIKRVATISGGAVAHDVIHLVVQDETMDSYTLRSFALYLDNGVLFALYGQATPIIEKSAQALMLLAIDVTLQDMAAGQVTFGDANFLQPSATTDRPGVVELATADEAKTGTDAARGITPATAKAAVRDWIGYTPANKAGDTFEGPVVVRHPELVCGLRVSTAGSGHGFVQLGEATQANASFNWHLGSNGDGSFQLYQGVWGSGVLRLHVTSAAILYNGNAIWHAANDGAGSGLDADMVDGLHGSQILADRPGLPIANVDQATSNGFYRVTYGDHSESLLAWTTGSSTGTVQMLFGYQGSVRWRNRVDNLDGRWTGWNTFWHTGNDGAGSGLDADMVDGRHAVEFALLTGADFTGPVTTTGAGGFAARGVAPMYQLSSNTGNVRYGYIQHGGAGGTLTIANDQSGPVQLVAGGGMLSVGASGTSVSGNFASSGAMTRSGNLVWDAGNDGAGSGLDADMVDGLQGAQLMVDRGALPAASVNQAISNGFYRVNYADNSESMLAWTAGSSTGTVQMSFGFQGSARWRNRVDNLDSRWTGWNTIWHSNNDGAGSGLDADLLDGWHRDDIRRWGNLLDAPGAFPAAAHTHGAADIAGAFANASFGPSGYQVLPNGLILQWCTGALNATGSEPTQFIGFPITFPNSCFVAMVSTRIAGVSNGADAFYQTAGDPATNGVTVQRQYTAQGSDNRATTPFVIAIGN